MFFATEYSLLYTAYFLSVQTSMFRIPRYGFILLIMITVFLDVKSM